MAETINFQGLRGELKHDEPMSKYLTWRAGGPARRFFAPADLEDLSVFLSQLPPDEPLLFVGLGSNLLVREGGWPGTVVLTYAAAQRPRLEEGLLYAEAGVACPRVAHFAADNNLGGAEFLTGIPGTVGGALAMNAGCYGGETWDIVERVVTINRRGQLRRRAKEEFEYGYRHCELKTDASSDGDEWFASAHFRLPEGDEQESRAIMKALLSKRRATQPLQLPNCGSVFRNPAEGKSAAKLIQLSGLKRTERNGARVSEKHANFIVNPGGAGSAADIEWLILHVQQVVEEETRVRLVPEVKIVGEPK
ncbi:MAG: UDP-N-acetylenolpyruvoylglucosamine reductase [Betaproteobacteria bacterium RBG_16_66_20]|nr:MAG: UDP-N-acetylenolpyruvoylglucosamine reductase [Betaproteobacteria bacterium RBG_16_66_20]